MKRALLSVTVFVTLAATASGGELAMKRQALVGCGTRTGPGLLHVMDSDHDGLGEFCYASYAEAQNALLWAIAEYRPVNNYELVKADTGPGHYRGIYLGNFAPSAVGDIDRDGLADIIGEIPYLDTVRGVWRKLVCTVESPDSFSYPDTVTWSEVDSFDPNGCAARRLLADLDQDSLLEIVATWYPGGTAVFENTADNQESLVYYYYAPGIRARPRTWADYDLNGRMDLACGYDYVTSIFECAGDNQYSLVCTLSTGLSNQYDGFSGLDVDRNGWHEFYLMYYRYIGRMALLYMFEPVAEHEYVCYPVDSLQVWDYGLASGLCVDLDGDGFEELVWACYTEVQVKQPRGPHDFETVYTWTNDHGRPSTVCAAADHNRNGYNELYVSANLKTSMLEVEAVRVLHPDTAAEFLPGDTCLVRWQTFEPPRCDSVALFLLSDTVVPPGEWFWNLDTIVTGLAPEESSFAWVVPDTSLEAAWVVAIAYGPGWQFDRSDCSFRIAPVGIEETGPSAWVSWESPTILRAPELARLDCRVIDALGRDVTDRRDRLAPGIYFLRSTVGCQPSAVGKVVVQR